MSDHIRAPSGWSIERSLQLWNTIRETLQADPELDFDEDVILRAFENAQVATPDRLLERLIDAATWADRREAEADQLHKAFRDRRDRYAERKDLLRRTIFDLMNVLGVRSHAAQLARARIQAAPDAVAVLKPALLPEDCFRVVRTPSKETIRAKLEAGDDLQGAAVLTNGGEILVLTKV